MPCAEGELFANLDVTPEEAADEAAMNTVRVWATVEDEDDVVKAMRGGRGGGNHGTAGWDAH